jgi:hypothetical protein
MPQFALLLVLTRLPMQLASGPGDAKRTRPDPKTLRFLPQVQAILLGVGRGGFEEAVIRMLILLAEAQAAIGRDASRCRLRSWAATSLSPRSHGRGGQP